MSKTLFNQKLVHLIQLLETYQRELKRHKSHIPNVYKKRFGVLKLLYKKLQKELKSSGENCFIKAALIQPKDRKLYFPKYMVSVHAQLSTGSCDWQKEAKLTVTYKGSDTERSLKENSIAAVSYVSDDKGGGVLSFELAFEAGETNATISCFNHDFTIRYTPYGNGIDTSTAENTKKAKALFHPFVLEQEQQSAMEVLVGKVAIAGKNYYGQAYINSTELLSKLQAKEMAGSDIQQMTVEQLKIQKSNYEQALAAIKVLDKAVNEKLVQYEALSFSYEGADAAVLFDASYQTTVTNAKELLKALDVKIATLQTAIKQLKEQPNNETTNEEANNTDSEEDGLAVHWTKWEEVKERLDNYTTLILSRKEWEEEVAAIDNSLSTLENATETTWSRMSKGQQTTYEGSYQNLKKVIQNLKVHANLEDKKEGLAKIKSIDKDGKKDGILSYMPKEDKPTRGEQDKYGQSNESELLYAETNKPLFDEEEGAELNDIDQGNVGDCFLLASLANFANEEDEHLLKSMIKEKGDNYIVTLHQNGIPVEVEVSKKIFSRSSLTGERDLMDNPVKKTVPIGAATPNDSWVAIIEKAYTKLVANSDLSAPAMTQGGFTAEAMQVLFGNKVQQPKGFYLDEEGNLTDQETSFSFKNPLFFSQIETKQLQQVIQSAKAKGYKINVSSPNTYKGTAPSSDRYFIKIGEKEYMALKHAYTLTAATNTQVGLFNPHNKIEDNKEVYSDELKGQMNRLKSLKEQLEGNRIINEEVKHTVSQLMKEFTQSESDNIKKQTRPLVNKWKTAAKKEFAADKIQAFLKKIESLLQTDLAHGYSNEEVNMEDKIHISYQVLKQYFEYLTITVVQ